MKRRVILPVALTLVAFVGCQSFEGYPKRALDVHDQLEMLSKYFDPNVYTVYSELPDAKKQAYRDEVLYGQLYAIDLHFAEFQKALSKESIGLNIGSDIAVIGVSGAAAVVNPASTKSILAAIAGGLTGAKQSIDKHLYYEKTMPAMLAQMEAGRRAVRVRIEAGLGKTPEEYPLGLALLDVNAYYEAGTLPAAVRSVVQGAGTAIEKADRELDVSRSSRYVKDASGDALRRFWKPDGETRNVANEQRIKDWIASDSWMQEHDFTTISITLFMRGQQFAEIRQRAAQELGLIP